MKEFWKDIEGYDGVYQVSNFGNVKSLNYRSTKQVKNLTLKTNNKGYKWIILYRHGKGKCVLVHRLVCNAFVPNLNDFPVINHKDENPSNNCVNNLEWCDRSYNAQYSVSRHLDKYQSKNRVKHPCNSQKPVEQYSLSGQMINHFDSIISACKPNNWKTSSIVDCCRGKRKTAYGYIWQYANVIDGREVI